MHVLIVEDNPSILSSLITRFQAESFVCSSLTSAAELEDTLQKKSILEPVFIVLDRLLGSIDAAILIPTIKRVWPESRLLVLSAIGTAKERAKLLELGADDYMNKPYEFDELMARLKALRRRSQAAEGEPVAQAFATNTHIDSEQRDLIVQSSPARGTGVERVKVGLTRQEFILATTLLQFPNRVFSKVKLLDLLWNSHPEVESNVVEATVSHLRRKLTRAGSDLRIQSKRQVGYWIEA